MYIIITMAWSKGSDQVELPGANHQIKWDAKRTSGKWEEWDGVLQHLSLRTEWDEVAAVRTDKTKHRRNAALSGHTEEVAQHIATITRPARKRWYQHGNSVATYQRDVAWHMWRSPWKKKDSAQRVDICRHIEEVTCRCEEGKERGT